MRGANTFCTPSDSFGSICHDDLLKVLSRGIGVQTTVALRGMLGHGLKPRRLGLDGEVGEGLSECDPASPNMWECS